MSFEIQYGKTGFMKKRNVTNIVNKECPFGYSFCWERKQYTKDHRYMQELRCHCIIQENDKFYCKAL